MIFSTNGVEAFLSTIGKILKDIENFIMYYNNYLGLKRGLFVWDVESSLFNDIYFNRVI